MIWFNLKIKLPLAQTTILTGRDQVSGIEPGTGWQGIQGMSILNLHHLAYLIRIVDEYMRVHAGRCQATWIRRPGNACYTAGVMLPHVTCDVRTVVLWSTAHSIAFDVLGVVHNGQELVRVRVANGGDEVALVQSAHLGQWAIAELINMNLIVLIELRISNKEWE